MVQHTVLIVIFHFTVKQEKIVLKFIRVIYDV